MSILLSRIGILLWSYCNCRLKNWWYLEFPKTALLLKVFSWVIFKTFPLGKKYVCLNFFQSGWSSTDARGCHLIGTCRGIGDWLKYFKYWNKLCCRNESDQTDFCARISTPNFLWRRLGQHCNGDKHLCDGDERQTRRLLLFL